MKLFARPNSFFEVMTLVIYINYAIGLRVFEYPRGHPRSILSLMYFLIVYVIYCGGVSSVNKYFKSFTVLKLDYVMYLLTGYIYNMSTLLKMVMGWWHSKKVAVCYKKILEIDKTLRQLGLAVNYNRIYFRMIGMIIIWLLLIIFLITAGFLQFEELTNILHAIYILLITIIAVTIDYINSLEFYVFSKCLQTKFELINHLLLETIRNLSMQKTKLGIFELKDYTKLLDFEQPKNISLLKKISQWGQRVYSASNFVLREQSPIMSQIEAYIPFTLKKKLQNKCRNQSHRNVSTIKCKNHVYLLQIMKQMHLELCKVSKLICSAFGIQITFEIGVILMSIIQTLYHLYGRVYIIQTIRITKQEKFLALIVIIFSTFKIFILSRVCKSAADEGNKTAELIHITYGCNTDIDMRDEMQQFGIQILHSPVIFNVFGLTMDNHILSMMLKTVTTYMVIMIQVSSSLESNNAIPDMHF